jgi:hypothetical protein
MKNIEVNEKHLRNKIICRRCIYDDSFPSIDFDSSGLCSYCRQIDELTKIYATGCDKGKHQFETIIDEIKHSGRSKKYDCIIGVSGGTDSSYLLMKAVDWGLRPLAVHYDNTWNNACATQNISKITKAFNIDLVTYVVDNKEADDIYRAFFLAGVPEWDASSDIAYVQVLRSAAAKYGIKHILEGHSFQAEGISPIQNNYFDGKYVSSIHKLFGTRPMRTFPNLTFFQFMKWTLVYRQKFIRPFWYLDYSKEVARKELQLRTEWEYYGGHHLENRIAVFGHTVYLPIKFGIDYRFLSLAASVRYGTLARAEALKVYNSALKGDPEIVEYIKKRLELSTQEYDVLMSTPPRSWHEFPTYKPLFEFLRPFFYILAKNSLVPMSFYLKYCFPIRKSFK